MTLADRIDALLPQTQCEQCGYHGCRPYAEAIARGEANINQCPPGGAAGIARLAALLDVPAPPLDPAHGVEKPRTLARIVEVDCIGCELCVPACPVDCIVLEPMPLAQVNDPAHADAARAHFQRREARLAREQARREAELAARKAEVAAATQTNPVLAALARARAKQGKPT